MGHGKHSHMSKGPEMGHSPNEMGHSPNEMSREFKYMPAVEDMTGQRASSIINAGARSRMSPMNMGHSPLEKKVKVNYKGKELTLDDRSQEYKSIMKHKENKQVETEAVMDRFGTNYTGLKKS